MSFPLYFSRKIALSKDNKNNLSRVIIFIGRLSVALGIIVSLITVSTGFGSKKAIKERLADFSGHITVKSTRSNSSYNTSVLDNQGLEINKIKELPDVQSVQKYAMVTGIMRNEHNFAGVIFKGVGKDFDSLRFKKFLIAGTTPKITEQGYNNGITISQKVANDLHLKVKDSIVTIFSKTDQKPVYRKFEVVGIYKTDIKMIDDQFVIGDINQVRKIQDMKPNEAGGIDIFLNNIDDIDTVFPDVEKLIGYKNYAEKATEKYPQIIDWISIFDTNIALIIIIMLIVVVINIIMVLLILIIERTNSIGLLKTLGASNAQIRATFINYTLIIMIPGLLYGNLIGLGLLLIQKFLGIIRLNPENYYVSTVPVDLNPVAIISISLGILIISGLALIVPSYLISKISPVKAIKYN
ncbi:MULTISPECIES: ABC transporter permease [Chryseobacterium]|uniref:Lipoprotein-releasing system permease protein n=1 Tax=Chryseobacterium camelliae TaxID=1265445 RepID=A0ABU0TLI2_9FLAO|nr:MULTISPECIES: FtsX-like permease family protein [Chryseobacterium]MDT3409058.1 lipoprotein-releasing system permease protein [Pseudacidovorax intermedius]MDQ1097083.1 lipoprotein-releasing system permease protein [Chryseobacterium camelliae]MDQ1101021.1 lipoprotein-releasing system permease protein [Chryseobacterium sp. SORGH_AS_1048]MDR6084463.1 lipoprotein-releasing system permease protein [Chryseobacterium sp. SORGH_AS_0909]MDR6132734.1 lipoprotein-releasing system permease protein [Chry